MQLILKSAYSLRKVYILVLLTILSLPSSGQKKVKVTYPKGTITTSDVLPKILKAEVIGIQDGDTIEMKFVFTGKKAGYRRDMPLRIRLLHVNTPERGKPYYKVAKQFTSDLCFRKIVQIRHEGNFDRYGRLLGEVVLPDGKILNKELVKKGYAVHFKKYSSSTEYSNLEIQAKNKKIGIWSLKQVNLGKF